MLPLCVPARTLQDTGLSGWVVPANRERKRERGGRVIPNKQKPRKQQVLHPLGGEKTTKNHKDLYSFHFWPPLRVHVHTQNTHDGIVRFRFGLLFHSKPYLPGSLRAGVLAYQMSWKEIGFGVVTLLLTHRELHPPNSQRGPHQKLAPVHQQ